MENKAKKKTNLTGFFNRRKFRYGGFATLLTVIVIAAVILVNVAVDAVENNWALTIDLTANNVTAFSDETYAMLNSLEDDVHIYTVYQPATSSELRLQIDAILAKFRAITGKVVLDNIDPVKEPGRLDVYSKDSLSEGAIIVTNADETRVKVINKTDYYTTQYNSYTQGYYTTFSAEGKLTSALLYVTSDNTPIVYFLSGHEEMDHETYCTLLTTELTSENYDVKKLDLTSGDAVLKTGDTVIVACPTKDLLDEEYQKLRDWVVTGGRMLFAMDNSCDLTKLPNFVKLLDYYHLGFDEGYIVEDQSASSNWKDSTNYLVPTQNTESTIMQQVAGGLYMPYCRPIKAVEFPESGMVYETLLTSSDLSKVQIGEETGDAASRIVAMTMNDASSDGDTTKDVRIALIGNVYTLYDSQLLLYSYNLNFTLSVIDWLVDRDVTVSVRSKLVSDSALNIPDSTTAWTLGAIVVIALPLIVAAFGVWVWLRRRHL